MKNNDEERKKITLEIANLYLSGFSLRQIAKIVNLSHVSVYRYLTVVLSEYDSVLSKEVEEIITTNHIEFIY